MEERELQELFRRKIHLELREFEHEMLCKEPEEVYYNAYRIDSMNDIYECLGEMSRKMEKPILEKLLVFPNLLAFLYDRWIKQEDSHMEELRACMREEVDKIQEKPVFLKEREGDL